MQPQFPGKILVIDDDQDIRDIYGEVLKDAGFELDFAADGEEAYKKISMGGYDVILLDIMMPKIDGIALLGKLKENPPSGYLGEIIIISQLNQPEVIKKALDLGAKGYIVKSSVTPDQVVARISEILKNTEKH